MSHGFITTRTYLEFLCGTKKGQIFKRYPDGLFDFRKRVDYFANVEISLYII